MKKYFLSLRLQLGSKLVDSIGIMALKTFNKLLARAKTYVPYEEKLSVSMVIYGGGFEKAQKNRRRNENTKQVTEKMGKAIKDSQANREGKGAPPSRYRDYTLLKASK